MVNGDPSAQRLARLVRGFMCFVLRHGFGVLVRFGGLEMFTGRRGGTKIQGIG